MQAILAGVAATEWRQHITQAWGWAQAQSISGQAFVLSLPSSCKLAILHTGLVCTGQTPEYIAIPGFAPLSYSWGWLLVGVVIGSAMAVLILSLVGQLRREPTIGALAAVARAPLGLPEGAPRHHGPPGLPAPRDQARDDILAFLAAGGRPALVELAAASGMSEGEFVLGLFGDAPRRRLQGPY